MHAQPENYWVRSGDLLCKGPDSRCHRLCGPSGLAATPQLCRGRSKKAREDTEHVAEAVF